MTLTRPFSFSATKNWSLAAIAVVAIGLSVTTAAPSSAQDDDVQSEELDDIRAEQERNEQAQEDAARGIDGTLAEISELTDAMEALDRAINKQELTVATASARLRISERRMFESEEAVAAAEAALVDLEAQLKQRAVESFIGLDTTTPEIVYTDQPGLTVRMESLLTAVLQGDADIAEAYSAVQNELAVEREDARLNRIAAEQFRLEVQTVQRRLEADRATQTELFIASEERLEHLLYEQQSLKEQGLALAEKADREIDKLAAALRASSYSGPGGTAGPVATPDQIVWVRGIAIHRDIADQLEGLMAAAAADGILLTGGGWRDPAAQIRLRRAHCGSSEYAIYQAPASSCRPPTARPGSSYHERGLAVDFSQNNRSINSPTNEAFLWLKSNAADYGFYNLPSERWHWSTTGK